MRRTVIAALALLPALALAEPDVGPLKPYPFPEETEARKPTGPEAWTTADTVMQATFLALMVVDWRQTLRASEGGRFYETNPILAATPTRSSVNGLFLTTACLHTLASLALPPKPRRVWQAISIGFQLSSVAHNFSVGAGFRW
jgi:hypothetical protein